VLKAIREGTLNLQGVFDDQINLERRIHHLSALADFNFVMYGQRDDIWVPELLVANSKLLRAYKFQPIENSADLARLYNQSKIGFNISRIAAANVGFSFRVPEVLASGALLATESESQPSLEAQGFREGRHYVAYKSPEHLKEICAYFLRHEDERLAI